jgi:predicted dehydrogenase
MCLKLIHVGVGGRGEWPVRQAADREDLQSVALVDVDETNLAAARKVSGVAEAACFGTLSEALSSVDADAVVVITPPWLHARQCLEAVRAGKHVLVEKPFALSLRDAAEVVREADVAGVRIAVCQNARYISTVVTMRRLVEEQTYGLAYSGTFTRHTWRANPKHSGTTRHSYLWELGIHDLDTIRYVFGSDPARVWGHSYNPPWSTYEHGAGVHACVEFESGASCGYSCNFIAPQSSSLFRVDAEGATLEIVGQELFVKQTDVKGRESIALDHSPGGETVLLDGFLRYIEEGEEPPFGGRPNLKTVGLVEAVGAASDRGVILNFGDYLEEMGAGF